ncbi:hypothetical protein NKH45_23320 [Mesorhizobium sp. M1156]|uniref:hypothetical protein n=1 Tax=unclassified Mesorhizobium TaxID=325217 RepID=UPI00333C0808
MSIGKVAVLAFIALAFVGGFLFIIVNKGTNRFAPAPKPVAILTPFDGKLAIESIDDLRVAGRKIVLCGVAFAKPQSMRVIVTEAMRRDYQGLALTCKPVGLGTPCDGNVAPKFRDAVVVQCLTLGGTDLAAKLVEAGILCGQPAQAGSTYKPCAPGA